MRGAELMASLLLGVMVVVGGCGNEDETTPSGTPTAVPQATEESAEEMKASAEEASEETKDAAGRLGDAAEAQLDTAADSLKENADAAANAAAADPAAADAVAKVKQVTDYIGKNQLDLAEKTLVALEQNKASLPAAVQSQITNARTMLDTAKKHVSATAPSPQ